MRLEVTACESYQGKMAVRPGQGARKVDAPRSAVRPGDLDVAGADRGQPLQSGLDDGRGGIVVDRARRPSAQAEGKGAAHRATAHRHLLVRGRLTGRASRTGTPFPANLVLTSR
jgi:hypothetical protein